MNQQLTGGVASLGSADLDSYVARLVGTRKAFLILAAVEILTLAPGARQVLRNWTAARYAAILGPVSVATLAVVLTTGGDGMVYASFLMILVGVSPLLVVTCVRQRLLVHRGLGSRDITLTAD